MSESIETLEKKLKIKKMDAHKDELQLQRAKLLHKAEKLIEEIALLEEQINELKNEIN